MQALKIIETLLSADVFPRGSLLPKVVQENMHVISHERIGLLENGEYKKSGRGNELTAANLREEQSRPHLNGMLKVAFGFTTTVLILILWILIVYRVQASSQSKIDTIQAVCTSPALRREWRSLSIYEQQSFLSALQCLKDKPSILRTSAKDTKLGGEPPSRYDDFVWVHIKLGRGTHMLALSLPWHRHFSWIFERVLQKECGYNDSLPYWDWTKDSASLFSSPVWDEKLGLGENGTGADGCVGNGMLTNWSMPWPSEHCIKRKFKTGVSYTNYTADFVQAIRKTSTRYHQFRDALESGPHNTIHMIIGGEMPTEHSPNGM